MQNNKRQVRDEAARHWEEPRLKDSHFADVSTHVSPLFLEDAGDEEDRLTIFKALDPSAKVSAQDLPGAFWGGFQTIKQPWM